jgi:hypothetical protein
MLGQVVTSFDELIEQSLAALNQMPFQTKGGSMRAHQLQAHRSIDSVREKESIDDFLVGYRQEMGFIREFIAQDDEMESSMSISNHKSMNSSVAFCLEKFGPNEPGRIPSKQIVEKLESRKKDFTPAQDMDQRSKGYLDLEISTGTSRNRLSTDKRKERRKMQNREYQRRYREKRKAAESAKHGEQ